MYKKLIISKEGDKPMDVHYEVGKGIESDDYEDLLNKFTPNFEFSLADKMIQEFSSDIVPSFKKSSLFTNEDLEEIIRPFKQEYMIKIPKKKKAITYFKPMTRRKKNKLKSPPKKTKTKTQKSKKINNKKSKNNKVVNKK